jgi:arsenite-transporting ATPase
MATRTDPGARAAGTGGCGTSVTGSFDGYTTPERVPEVMDVPVEPVEEITEETVPAGIEGPEYVLYGGKGGVGKTTMAAATALASARGDTPTLVVSTDPAHSLSDTLETAVPEQPGRIREEIPLYAAEIDPETAVEEGHLDGSLGGMFGGPMAGSPGGPMAGSPGGPMAGSPGGPMAGSPGGPGQGTGDPGAQGASMPGSDEVAAIRLLLAFFEDERFDRVVVDTAPTGHTLRLLELPEMLDSMASQMLEVHEQFDGLLGGLGGGESGAGTDQLSAFADRIERLRAALRDPDRTDFRLVMVPEELSVRESERLLDRLETFEIPVGTVVVNRVMQDPAEVADIDVEFVAPNHTDCAFCERRWQIQKRALARAQDVFRGHRVLRVPLLAEEVRGERLLRVVAACLADTTD